MGARKDLPEPFNRLLRSQLETIIYESALHRDDDLIARRYLIDKWAQMDIAEELGWRRATVGDHLKRILPKIEQVAKQMNAKRA